MLDESRFRDASDGSLAPLRKWPDPYDEPDDFTNYTGPHGALHAAPDLSVCVCGWHPHSHPGYTIADHLKDWQ
ncbi:hypothetical protein [Streptomyces sp. NPDC001165]|uniref:hypothetical protein n=1 Tax=Streptomyces sp. NPDC001165 TaxID=3364546 RepID=UPI0036C78980